MKRTRPPFRADHVGSLLRPASVKQAREQQGRGEISVADLEAVEDREIERVTGVLENHLGSQEKGADGPWLVGGKFSYADLAFVPWQVMLGMMPVGLVDLEKYTVVKDWMERLVKREAIGEVVKGFPGRS